MTLTNNTFIGEYTYSLDSKGRVNIPSKFRQTLSTDNQNTFVITRGLDSCIWVYPLVQWKEIEENLRKLSSLSSFIELLFGTQHATPPLPLMINRDG